MRLAILAQPSHEAVHRLLALRRHAVVLPLEQPIDQDWQLVNREDERPLVFGQGRENFVPLVLPVAGVDTGAQFHLDLRDGQRIDAINHPLKDIGKPGLDATPCALHGH